MIRIGKKRCRAFLESYLGMPWAEIQRELRRCRPIEVEGVEGEGEGEPAREADHAEPAGRGPKRRSKRGPVRNG